MSLIQKPMFHKSHSSHLLKKALPVLAVGLLTSFAATRLLATNAKAPKHEQIIAHGTLTVATVKNHSTLFEQNGLKHGFGYDVVAQYAKHLGVEPVLHVYADEQSAMQAVTDNKADFALLSNTPLNTINQPIACQNNTQKAINKQGLDGNLGFVMDVQDAALLKHAKTFLCSEPQQSTVIHLANFYSQDALMGAYNQRHFQNSLKKLPLYEYALKTHAKHHNQDWRLLAMIAYQESRFDPNAISPTGVQGLMMLTQDTAKDMGIKDRLDVNQSIQGGAKYLQKLDKDFANIPKSDRLWFVLAAYNMGPNALKNIQKQLRAKGVDDTQWFNVYAHMSAHPQNAKYTQCLRYVTNIRTYLEAVYSTHAHIV